MNPTQPYKNPDDVPVEPLPSLQQDGSGVGPHLPSPIAHGSTITPQVISPTLTSAQPFPSQPPDPSPASPSDLSSNNIYSGPMIPSSPPPTKKWFKNKRIMLPVAASVLILSAAGVIFGWYIPNRPQNVYATGLDRTGEIMEKLIVEGLEKNQLETIKKSEISGKIDASGPSVSYSGTFSSKYDPKLNDSNLDFKYKPEGEAEKSLGVKYLSDLPEGSDFPDIYIKLTGLKSLGLDVFLPGAGDYDGKWISISSKYLESLVPEGEAENQQESFSYQDTSDLAVIIAGKTREYLLSSDAAKSVLINKAFVGTESLADGITANRYTIGINKANAKKYCQALITELMSADAYKRFPGVVAKDIETNKKDAIKGCQDSVEQDIKDDDSFDMWVDKKYKLIHKIRITDKQDKENYFEIGQSYKGGDTIPLFALTHSGKEKYDAKLTLDINRKTYNTAGTFSFDQTGDNAYSVTASFGFKPYSGDLKVDKPAGAVPIQEILKRFGLDSYVEDAAAGGSGASTASSAKDTERKTDIHAIHGQLEAHYAINGFYPNLSQINSPTWRASNFQGLSDEALKDPDGSEAKLAARATPNQYDYTAAGCSGGAQCQSYGLSATLSDGSHYTKQSLSTL